MIKTCMRVGSWAVHEATRGRRAAASGINFKAGGRGAIPPLLLALSRRGSVPVQVCMTDCAMRLSRARRAPSRSGSRSSPRTGERGKY